MKSISHLFISLLLLSTTAWAEKGMWPIKKVQFDAAQGKRVVVQGRTVHKLSHTHFVLEDKTGRLVVNSESVNYDFNKGEILVVMGLYDESEDYPKYKSEIEAFEIAMPYHKKKVTKWVNKNGYDPKEYEPEPEAVQKPSRSNGPIEDRLNKLSELKNKNLITDEEYKEQRKRILDSL